MRLNDSVVSHLMTERRFLNSLFDKGKDIASGFLTVLVLVGNLGWTLCTLIVMVVLVEGAEDWKQHANLCEFFAFYMSNKIHLCN